MGERTRDIARRAADRLLMVLPAPPGLLLAREAMRSRAERIVADAIRDSERNRAAHGTD